MKKNSFSFVVCACLMALSGCSSTKDNLGLTKKSPDEFAVLTRAPLAMPPDFNLRPPAPGMPRPQEQATNEKARGAVFGSEAGAESADKTDGEKALLARAGVQQADPNVRRTIDAESRDIEQDSVPVAKKILGLGGKVEAPAQVVDAAKEAERIQANKAAGKPVTAGETPSVKR